MDWRASMTGRLMKQAMRRNKGNVARSVFVQSSEKGSQWVGVRKQMTNLQSVAERDGGPRA